MKLPSTSDESDSSLGSLAEKTVGDVLRRFGETVDEARIHYRDFMIKGISLGRRPEFQGGGLIRSMGEKKAALAEIRKGNTEKSDSRILGDGQFIQLTLAEAEKMLEKKYLPKRSIEELIEDVAVQIGVTPELICSGSRNRNCSKARAMLAYLAVKETGHSASEVARYLGVGKRVCFVQLKRVIKSEKMHPM